jgi:uncharacterized protein (TIGR03084 family)
MERDVLKDLEDEQTRLDQILGELSVSQRESPSGCAGWTITDVVLHLAQTEEAVLGTLTGSGFNAPAVSAASVDELMDQWVAAERGAPGAEVLERWRRARRAALEAYQQADPSKAVQWAAAPLKPRSLATTRISEHWIHTLDIADPLGIPVADTDRLWQISRLAHRTLPYAFSRAGRGDAPTVRLELDGPTGERWEFGDGDAEVVVQGAAGEFCRVAARRLSPTDARSIRIQGGRSAEVLELVRTYA